MPVFEMLDDQRKQWLSYLSEVRLEFVFPKLIEFIEITSRQIDLYTWRLIVFIVRGP